MAGESSGHSGPSDLSEPSEEFAEPGRTRFPVSGMAEMAILGAVVTTVVIKLGRDKTSACGPTLRRGWQAELHADFNKVHDNLAREVFLAIAAASKDKGISFVGHVPASMTPAEASDLGQKSIEHLEFVPKSCHALFELPAAAPRHVPSGCDRNHFTSCFIGSRTMVPGSTPLFRVSVTGRRRSRVRSFRNFVNWFGQSGRTTSRFSQARTRAAFSKRRVIHPAPACMTN